MDDRAESNFLKKGAIKVLVGGIKIRILSDNYQNIKEKWTTKQ